MHVVMEFYTLLYLNNLCVFQLPNLRHSMPKRSGSPDSKPPLPRPGSRGSNRRPDSAASTLHGSGEFRASIEEPTGPIHSGDDLTTTGTGSSTFGMVTALQTNEQTADILTIQHEEDAKPGLDETDKGLDETDKGLGETDKLYEGEKAEDKVMDDIDADQELEPRIATDDEYEMPPKTKMVDDMTLSYQYALEDTLDNDVVSDSATEEDDGEKAAEPSNMQTLAPIMEVNTPKEKSPRPPRPTPPTPKRRTSLTPRTDSIKDTTPRSQARTNTTSESLDISDLDEDEESDF